MSSSSGSSFQWRAAPHRPQVVPQRLRLNKLSGWAVLLGIGAAFVFGAASPGGYAASRAPQEVRA